jgi:hypothetical protein
MADEGDEGAAERCRGAEAYEEIEAEYRRRKDEW